MPSVAKREFPKFERDGGRLPPLIRELYYHVCDSDLTFVDVSKKSGVPIDTIARWFNRGQEPGFLNFVAVANAAGYEVQLSERES
jgi:hypothetical protein